MGKKPSPASVRPGEWGFQPADFFVFRTPLLPIEELHAFSAGLEAPAGLGGALPLQEALQRDRTLLRDRLRRLIERPEVREALFVASPSLDESLGFWERDPDGERGRKVERTLVRYFVRMAGRSTPFGLFAGCSVGYLSDETELRLAPRSAYRRHSRLDGDYLTELTAALSTDPRLAAELRYRPNSSLYQAAGRVRYVETRLQDKVRSHYLVAVDVTPYLLATLARATPGAPPALLAQALRAEYADLPAGAAEAYIAELIAHQILMPELTPGVTGPEPLSPLVEQLAQLDCPSAQRAATTLSAAREALVRLDQEPLGSATQGYRDIASGLATLPTPVELARLFQVDLVKPAAGSTLGRAVLDELRAGVALLHRLSEGGGDTLLRRFRAAFQQRYEAREVPLCEVLDEESGIGSLNEPELPRTLQSRSALSPRDGMLLRKLMEALRSGVRQIAIEDEDLDALSQPERPPLPDSFAVLATVRGRGETLRVQLDRVMGPSGANLLGRFCHGDAALTEHVRRYLQAEEAHHPASIFAEVVHLPEGRIGNVLLRPVLRNYELPYLGCSGAPAQQQLAVTDLLVSVRGGRVVLRSARLEREIVPRLTTAHNFLNPRNLLIYRFLCELAGQGVCTHLQFRWGALAGLPYLPRVVYGRLVLKAARWNLSAAQILALSGTQEASARYRAVQSLRLALQLPRFVAVEDADNLLPVDLDNVLTIEAGVALLKQRDQATLVELDLQPEDMCATAPEGSFVHELVVPFLRTPDAAASHRAAQATSAPESPGEARPYRAEAPIPRRFMPGSEWLYIKIYTGTAGVDEVLAAAVRPVVNAALSSGAAAQWFFLRYRDPDWHLRLRLRGAPQRLLGEVVPMLHAALVPLLAAGLVFRFQLDTYDREIERYGGPLGLRLSERLFHADSEAVLAIVETQRGDAGAEARWRICIAGIDRLLDDLGLDLLGKRKILQRLRQSYGRELHAGAAFERQLSDKYRKERSALQELLALGVGTAARAANGHVLSPALAALRRRSTALTEVAAELQQAEASGRLSMPVERLADSYIHMHANRLLRSATRTQELIVYSYLARLYDSRVAQLKTISS